MGRPSILVSQPHTSHAVAAGAAAAAGLAGDALGFFATASVDAVDSSDGRFVAPFFGAKNAARVFDCFFSSAGPFAMAKARELL